MANYTCDVLVRWPQECFQNTNHSCCMSSWSTWAYNERLLSTCATRGAPTCIKNNECSFMMPSASAPTDISASVHSLPLTWSTHASVYLAGASPPGIPTTSNVSSAISTSCLILLRSGPIGDGLKGAEFAVLNTTYGYSSPSSYRTSSTT